MSERKVERGRLTALPRHAYAMGYGVGAALVIGDLIDYPDNPFNLKSEPNNHRAWQQGFDFAHPDADDA